MATAATLQTDIVLNISEFERNQKRAVQSAQQLERGMDNIQKHANNAAKELTKASKAAAAKIDTSGWKKLGDEIKKLGNVSVDFSKMKAPVAALSSVITSSLTAAFASATAAAVGFFAFMKANAADAKTILQDSVRLNIDTTTLQQWSIAGQKFGLNADKVADVMKDVNDKIGDFVMTGGGEAKDLFEQLNLDAKEFIGLSPDKVLEKMAKAAEGLTVQDKTFLFESLADDASLLLPLLEKNSAKLNEIKGQTLQKGMILSEAELKALERFNNGLSDVFERVKAFGKHVAAYMAEPLQVLMAEVNKIVEGFGGMDNVAMSFAKSLINGIRGGIKLMVDLYVWVKEFQVGLLKSKAFILSMIQGLARAGELFLKYTPAGRMADVTAAATTGSTLSSGLAQSQKEYAKSLDELSEQQAALSVEIEQSRKKYADNADRIGDAMINKINEMQTNLTISQKSGYSATAPQSDAAKSLEKWQKAQADAAAKESEKTLKAAEKQESAANKMMEVADKQAQSMADWEIQAKLYQNESEIRARSVQSKINGLSPEEWIKAEQERINAIHKEREEVVAGINQIRQNLKNLQESGQAADESFKNLARSAQTVVGAPENGQSSSTLTPPTATQNINIALSGDIGVKLDGANDTVAQAVLANSSFKLGIAELIKPELMRIIQGAAVSVGRPII